jgi:hypothetical protein
MGILSIPDHIAEPLLMLELAPVGVLSGVGEKVSPYEYLIY